MNRLAKTFFIGLTGLAILLVGGSMLMAAPQSSGGRDVVAAQAAARLFEHGDYALAAQSYRQLIDQGHADPAIYYNLGLAYAQSGDLAHAYWSLRNAQQLAPRDADVRAALAQLQMSLGEPRLENALLATGRDNLLAQISNVTSRWLTLDELAWLALGLWTVMALTLLVSITAKRGNPLRKPARALAINSGALLLVAALALGARLVDARQPPAIIVAEQVALVAGPGAQYGGAITLRGGSEVSVVEQRGDWVEVAADVAAGRVHGWLPAAAAQTVFPTTVGS